MPASYKMFKQGCKAALQGIEKDIKQVEKQLQALIHSDEKRKQPYSIATSVKGIGPVTACPMILCSGDDKNTNRQTVGLLCRGGAV